MKRFLLICSCCLWVIALQAQMRLSFQELFSTGSMEPYVGKTVTLTDTLVINGWGNAPRFLWLSDHRIVHDCEQGVSPRKAYLFSLQDTSNKSYWRLGSKVANITMIVTSHKYATLQGSATYLPNERQNRHESIGNYSLKVCGFNVENFFISTTATEAKRAKVLAALTTIDADIYALAEMGEHPNSMSDLVDAINLTLGSDVYAPVQDNITSNSTYSRSGIIYKKTAVAPYGGFGEATPHYIYKKRNIVQGFRCLGSGEQFVLSMNHFKSKSGNSGSNDSTEQTRITNANDLISYLQNSVPSKYNDDDILILGDLNTCTGEPPLQLLYNAGYNCLFETYNPNTYSIRYQNSVERLDHALASKTMQSQVTGATIFHINSDEHLSFGATNATDLTMFRCADHDPVIVGVRLGKTTLGQKPQSLYQLQVVDGELLIHAPLNQTELVYLYTISGQLITSVSFNTYVKLELPTSGIYLVRIGNQSYKVVR